MNRHRVHNIVEYIKTADEFPFDTDDVVEDLDKVLQFFGIGDALYTDEMDALRNELRELALAEEYAEVARISSDGVLDILLGRACRMDWPFRSECGKCGLKGDRECPLPHK